MSAETEAAVKATAVTEAADSDFVDLEKKRRWRPGDRYDGRRVRSLPPMMYLTPFIMTARCDVSNYFRATIELDAITDYLRRKSRDEGLKTAGFMHVLAAAYVRLVSQYPAMNRFISGQRIFQRKQIVMSMMVKKDMSINAQETAIKPVFERNDSFYDVYRKMEEQIAVARKQSDSTALDTVARGLFKLPTLLLKGFIDLMRFLDYFGIMPKVIHNASPFHCSLFISNLGSLGIPPIYHHLYNFGNVPVFITFGSIYRENRVDKDGSVRSVRCLDYTVVTDERITDGHCYSAAFKQLDWLLRHPEELDRKPDEVVFDIK